MRRIFQSPARHKSNRSGNTGTWAEKGERYAADKSGLISGENSSSQNPCLGKVLTHSLRDFSTFFVYSFSPGHKYDIVAGTDFLGQHNKCRADHTTGAVSLYGVADLFTCRNANTTNARAVLVYVSNQRRICICFSAAVSAAEISVGF